MVQNKIKRISEEEKMKKWKEDNDPYAQLNMACKKIAALEQRCGELEDELRKWRDSRDGVLSHIEELKAENAELRKKLEGEE